MLRIHSLYSYIFYIATDYGWSIVWKNHSVKRRSCCAAAWFSSFRRRFSSSRESRRLSCSCRRRFSLRNRRTSSSSDCRRCTSCAILTSREDRWDFRPETEFLERFRYSCYSIDRYDRAWYTRVEYSRVRVTSIDEPVVGPLLRMLLRRSVGIVVLIFPTVHIRIVMILRVFDRR